MGIYSTLDVTRGTAFKTVEAQLELELQRVRAEEFSDAELQRRLDELLEPQFNNARIVDDDEKNDDDRVPVPGF